MKHTLLTITLAWALAATAVIVQAQPSGERIKSLKISFITSELDLSPEEAQQFWPIYNQYDAEMMALEEEGRVLHQKYAGRFHDLSDTEAEEVIQSNLDREEQELELKRKYYDQLEEVVGSAKVLILMQAERKFRLRLLEILKEHRQGRSRPRF